MALCVSVSGLSSQRSLWGRFTKGTVNNNSEKHINAHLVYCLKLNKTPHFHIQRQFSSQNRITHSVIQLVSVSCMFIQKWCRLLFNALMTVRYLLTSTLCNTQVDQHHCSLHHLLVLNMWLLPQKQLKHNFIQEKSNLPMTLTPL